MELLGRQMRSAQHWGWEWHGNMCLTSSPAQGMRHSTLRAAISSDGEDLSQLRGWKCFVAAWKWPEGSCGSKPEVRALGESCSFLQPAAPSKAKQTPKTVAILYYPHYILTFLDAKGIHLGKRFHIPLDLAVPPAFNHSFSIDPFAGIRLAQLPASVSPNTRPCTGVPTRTVLSCPPHQSAFPPVGPSGPQQHLTTLPFLAWCHLPDTM